MSDIMSILQSAYASAPLSTPTSSNAPYTNVKASDYQGTWSGTFNNNQNFELNISQVNGFRAEVKYQSGSTVSYQSVLIKGGSFRVGDTRFTLSNPGTPAQPATANAPATAAQGGVAAVKAVITDPSTGNTSLIQGNATQQV
jgi:hypothetical protein